MILAAGVSPGQRPGKQVQRLKPAIQACAALE